MLNNQFIKAKPIYPKNYEKEMNFSFFFVCEINSKTIPTLRITGNNVYRIFVNGNLLGVGPARSSHDYYRVEEYSLNKGFNRIVVELAAYNCNSYYFLNTTPFLQMEIYNNEGVISYTGDSNIKCYLNKTKFQKVTRFSYQRTFSESYIFDNNIHDFYIKNSNNFELIECEVQKEKKYLDRNVNMPLYQKITFSKIEEGVFSTDNTKKEYEDRYMYQEHLKIFPKKEWEVNPNDYISLLNYKRVNIDSLSSNTFVTYELISSKTGFISFNLECFEDSEIYFVFDEIDSKNEKNIIDISFFRNTTHNIISYFLSKGKHSHITFEPYTMKYLRIVIRKGNIKINNLEFILYENPDICHFEAEFDDFKVNSIKDAAISTFAHNAVDILTDCPSRERAGWLFDSYFTGKAEYLITGVNKVEKNFLENYALLEQYPTLPKGMIPMCYPGEHPDGIFIPNWSLWYILEVYDYYKRNNDDEILEKSKNKIRDLLDYFSKFENELGLLENLESWIFVEWSKANDEDFVKGVNFPSNMLYARALEVSSILLNDKSLVEKSNHIKEQIIKYSFNGMFFEDNLVRNEKNELVKVGHTTETCQYYAFFFEIAKKDNFGELYSLLVNEFGPKRDYDKVFPLVYKSNVINGYYLRLFILLRDGNIHQVKEEIVEYFYNMSKITGTLWEHDNTFASLNHGLTSVILNIISEIYFGLVDYNFKEKYLIIRNNVIEEKCVLKLHSIDGDIIINNQSGELKVETPSSYRIKYIYS